MRTLCFGGSFNPIHHGHLLCARAAAEATGAERIMLIPSCQPPHKAINADLAAPGDRLALCQLAIEGDPLFVVSDVEFRRTGPSYTIDTVRQLRTEGHGEVSWLIGADMLRILPQWHEPYALLRETTFVILARPGWTFDWETLPPEFRGLEANVVGSPQMEISSTDIRARLRAGRPVNYLTPPAVVDFMRWRGLYV